MFTKDPVLSTISIDNQAILLTGLFWAPHESSKMIKIRRVHVIYKPLFVRSNLTWVRQIVSSYKLMISEICRIFIVLKKKKLWTIIAMITESKVIELFCMADDFCKFFDAMMTKYTLKPATKRKYHRVSTLSKAEIMLIMILFHDSGYRCLKHLSKPSMANSKI